MAMVFGTAEGVVAGVLKLLGSPGRKPGDRPDDPPACARGLLKVWGTALGMAESRLMPRQHVEHLVC